MAELDHQLRDLIDAAATPVTPDEIRSRTLHHLGTPTTGRHRRHGLLVAATLLLAALTGSLLIATLAGDDDGPTITDPNPDTETGDIVEVVSDGVLYAVSDGRATRIETPTLVATPIAAPTRTDHGLVALTDVRDGKGRLVAVDQGQVSEIAYDIYAFTVDPADQAVASSFAPGVPSQPGGRTAIGVANLRNGGVAVAGVDVATAPDSSSYAVPVGWAGPYVMLNLGDGAGATAAYWRPGDASITTIGSGTVLATDPNGPRAIIAMGDSGCGTLFTILDGGGLSAEPPTPGTPVCSPSAISPDGSRVASIEPNIGSLAVRSLLPPMTRTDVGNLGHNASDDLVWLDNDRVAVAGNGRLTVCTLPDSCTTTKVPWTGPAPMTIVRDHRGATQDHAAGDRTAEHEVVTFTRGDVKTPSQAPVTLVASSGTLAVAFSTRTVANRPQSATSISTDGRTWREVPSPWQVEPTPADINTAPLQVPVSLVWGAERFVAAGVRYDFDGAQYRARTVVAQSQDGVKWEVRPVAAVPEGQLPTSLIKVDEGWLLATETPKDNRSSLFRSPDGLIWSAEGELDFRVDSLSTTPLGLVATGVRQEGPNETTSVLAMWRPGVGWKEPTGWRSSDSTTLDAVTPIADGILIATSEPTTPGASASSGTRFLRSDDGSTWTPLSTPACLTANTRVTAAASTTNSIALLAAGGPPLLALSQSNGSTWSCTPLTGAGFAADSPDNGPPTINGITATGGSLIVFGGRAADPGAKANWHGAAWKVELAR